MLANDGHLRIRDIHFDANFSISVSLFPVCVFNFTLIDLFVHFVVRSTNCTNTLNAAQVVHCIFRFCAFLRSVSHFVIFFKYLDVCLLACL